MIVNRVRLTNFRNIEKCDIVLSSGINVFVGKNAQGKTNFLESIYMCSTGRARRQSTENEIIMKGKTHTTIDLDIEEYLEKSHISIAIEKGKYKTLTINSFKLKSLKELIGFMPVIYFAPREINILLDAPFARRNLIDQDLSLMSKRYFKILCDYNEILENRNKILKTYQNLEELDTKLDVWDEKLVERGAEITLLRLSWVEELNNFSKEIHGKITNGKENLEIVYSGYNFKEKNDIKKQFLRDLKKKREYDKLRGFTSVGPHRDDLIIKINGENLKNFASTGQIRLAMLSLKLAELDMYKYSNKTPLLLLDDALNELDDERLFNLIKECKSEGVQVILTTTKYNYALGKDDSLFSVLKGKITKEEIGS